MGEVWKVVPMTRGTNTNGASVPDPARPASTAVGIFSDPPQMLGEVKGFLPTADKRPGLFAGKAKIEFDPRQPANAGLVLRELDVLVRDDGSSWRIDAPAGDAMGRLICYVTKN